MFPKANILLCKRIVTLLLKTIVASSWDTLKNALILKRRTQKSRPQVAENFSQIKILPSLFEKERLQRRILEISDLRLETKCFQFESDTSFMHRWARFGNPSANNLVVGSGQKLKLTSPPLGGSPVVPRFLNVMWKKTQVEKKIPIRLWLVL